MTALSFIQVEIDGFRGLRSLNLDGLGRVNILVGRNNSGKTSVLEALSILCQPQNPYEWLSMVRRRDFGGLDESIVQSLRWCFTQSTALTEPEMLIEAACKFKCNGKFELRELSVNYSEFLGEPSPDEIRRNFSHRRRLTTYSPNEGIMMRGAELEHLPVWLQSSIMNEKTRILKVWENSLPLRRYLNGVKIDSKTLTPYSYQLNRMQVQSQSNQIFKNDSPSVLELLKDFDADVEGIDMASFSGGRTAIYINHRKLGVAPLSVFGDAMRRAVLLAATLPSIKEGGVLLIDEVEVGIHVGALTNVFKWLVDAARKLKIQIFVTTHSLEALDALISTTPKKTEDDIVAFHLTQTEEGTQCKRFSGDLLHRLRFERGLDVR
jgi:energy-coupling factor transporter ATP-binding protein EcfA2